jgi:hypothetical protein
MPLSSSSSDRMPGRVSRCSPASLTNQPAWSSRHRRTLAPPSTRCGCRRSLRRGSSITEMLHSSLSSAIRSPALADMRMRVAAPTDVVQQST